MKELNNGALRLKNIEYAYPKSRFTLSIADMALLPGECCCLRGKNGSGKTTLGKIIAGIIKPDSGGVYWGEQNIVEWSLGKKGGVIGYLFQEPSRQIFSPTVLEELTFIPMLKNVPKEQAHKDARETLARFEMPHLLNVDTYTLSRGEKQRLAIGAMMAGEPSFMVLDEPTTGLDERRRAILGELVTRLVKNGIGILLISHDERFAARFSQRSVFIENGRLA
jgi:energy-coupling factor transport system ATP-binding protein